MTDRVYSHVLVPTDFDPACQAAYRLALATASGTGACVTLLHVAPMPVGEPEEQFRGLAAIQLMHHAADGWGGWRPSPEAIAAENAELGNRLRAEVPTHQAGPVQVRTPPRRIGRGGRAVRAGDERGSAGGQRLPARAAHAVWPPDGRPAGPGGARPGGASAPGRNALIPPAGLRLSGQTGNVRG
jgi:hypothetical protein